MPPGRAGVAIPGLLEKDIFSVEKKRNKKKITFFSMAEYTNIPRLIICQQK